MPRLNNSAMTINDSLLQMSISEGCDSLANMNDLTNSKKSSNKGHRKIHRVRNSRKEGSNSATLFDLMTMTQEEQRIQEKSRNRVKSSSRSRQPALSILHDITTNKRNQRRREDTILDTLGSLNQNPGSLLSICGVDERGNMRKTSKQGRIPKTNVVSNEVNDRRKRVLKDRGNKQHVETTSSLEGSHSEAKTRSIESSKIKKKATKNININQDKENVPPSEPLNRQRNGTKRVTHSKKNTKRTDARIRKDSRTMSSTRMVERETRPHNDSLGLLDISQEVTNSIKGRGKEHSRLNDSLALLNMSQDEVCTMRSRNRANPSLNDSLALLGSCPSENPKQNTRNRKDRIKHRKQNVRKKKNISRLISPNDQVTVDDHVEETDDNIVELDANVDERTSTMNEETHLESSHIYPAFEVSNIEQDDTSVPHISSPTNFSSTVTDVTTRHYRSKLTPGATMSLLKATSNFNCMLRSAQNDEKEERAYNWISPLLRPSSSKIILRPQSSEFCNPIHSPSVHSNIRSRNTENTISAFYELNENYITSPLRLNSPTDSVRNQSSPNHCKINADNFTSPMQHPEKKIDRRRTPSQLKKAPLQFQSPHDRSRKIENHSPFRVCKFQSPTENPRKKKDLRRTPSQLMEKKLSVDTDLTHNMDMTSPKCLDQTFKTKLETSSEEAKFTDDGALESEYNVKTVLFSNKKYDPLDTKASKSCLGSKYSNQNDGNDEINLARNKDTTIKRSTSTGSFVLDKEVTKDRSNITTDVDSKAKNIVRSVIDESSSRVEEIGNNDQSDTKNEEDNENTHEEINSSANESELKLITNNKIEKVKPLKSNGNSSSTIQSKGSDVRRSTRQRRTTDRLTFERKRKSSKTKNLQTSMIVKSDSEKGKTENKLDQIAPKSLLSSEFDKPDTKNDAHNQNAHEKIDSIGNVSFLRMIAKKSDLETKLVGTAGNVLNEQPDLCMKIDERSTTEINLVETTETSQENDKKPDNSKIEKVKPLKSNINSGFTCQNKVSNSRRSTRQRRVTDRLTFERKRKSSKTKNNGDTEVNAQNETIKTKINNDPQSEVKSEDDYKNEPCEELINQNDMIQNDDVVGSVPAIVQHEINTKSNSECNASISDENIMRNGRNIERSETTNKTVSPKNIDSMNEKLETLESLASSTTGPMNLKLKRMVLKATAKARKLAKKRDEKTEDITYADSNWTKSEEEQLRHAQLKIDPRLPNFWEKVASLMNGKVASECREKCFSVVDEKNVQRKSGLEKQPNVIKNTCVRLKSSQTDQKDETVSDEEDDIFNSTPLRGVLRLGNMKHQQQCDESTVEKKPARSKTTRYLNLPCAFVSPIANDPNHQTTLSPSESSLDYTPHKKSPHVIVSKAYMKKIKRKGKKVSVLPKRKVRNKLAINRNKSIVSTTVGENNIKIKAQLTPRGTVHVQAPEESDLDEYEDFDENEDFDQETLY